MPASRRRNLAVSHRGATHAMQALAGGLVAPGNIVRTVYEQLEARGPVRRGTIGVAVQSVPPILADALRLPVAAGAIVAALDSDGPAARAGRRPGLAFEIDG